MRCADRVSGYDCKQYLFESMTEPSAFLLEGYNPIMPDMRRVLSADQIWAVIAFLQSQGGEVTVTAEDVGSAADGEPAEPAAGGGASASATQDPEELMASRGCFGCHQRGGLGTALGPALDGVGGRRSAEHIRQSILDPAAEVAEGYEAFAALMPTSFGDQLSAAQLEALVRYLAAQR